eukprot:TRINITY_DN61800_c0_g1_i1.p1 TRINITY_DN61800_c0_g1~~TRINITY_DN61800_c0_g1_i1.p1  ORF type:complete len:928 (+),score=117.86 TRINITY_DN61800_c0_g1_i1:78-2861(+)
MLDNCSPKKKIKLDNMTSAQPAVNIECCSGATGPLMKYRLQELMKAYHYQIATGCGSSDCTTNDCRSNKDFTPLDEPASWELCKKLSRDGFRKTSGEPTPVYHFCPRLHIPYQWLIHDIIKLDVLRNRKQADKVLYHDTINCAFSSPISLAHSFTTANLLNDNPTAEDMGLDVPDLKEAFAFIFEDTEAAVVLDQALQTLVAKLEKGVNTDELASLRTFMIVFLFPKLNERKRQTTVLVPLLRATCALPKTKQQQLVKWATSVDVDLAAGLATWTKAKQPPLATSFNLTSYHTFEAGSKENQELYHSTITRVFAHPPNLFHSFLRPSLNLLSDFATTEESNLDLDAVRKTYKLLLSDEKSAAVLTKAIEKLAKSLAEDDAEYFHDTWQVRSILIAFEFPPLDESQHQGTLLAPLLRSVCQLPPLAKKALSHWWSLFDKDHFERVALHVVQNFITIQLSIAQYVEKHIAEAVITLSLLYDANRRGFTEIEEGLINYKEFYNDGVNHHVNLKNDFARWSAARKQGADPTADYWKKFCFINYPFLLDPATKAEVLKYDANQQRHDNFLQHLMQGSVSFLVLEIDRHNLIQSALMELDLKRDFIKNPLRVKFQGEDGIDEGGVQKEFFQLTIKELFDAQFGMFTYNEQTHLHWFNPHALESETEFRLVGLVFGLAIYNSVILEIRFPLAVYKKMLGQPVGLKDLYHLDEAMYKGLVALLEFDEEKEGVTVEETFERTFVVESEAYGAKVVTPLKENGENIVLTKDNRQEYVDLYVKYTLEESIAKQFDAFNAGFQVVAGGDVLQMFCAEELELLICGSPELDFHSMEKECKYDGFKEGEQYIKDFWDIVHNEFTHEDRKGLLKFSTGSDRVPIKGLKDMLFVIIKNGDDSDRLPTAHTCFNYLLLPRYDSKDKLKQKLLAAVNNCTGFGLK